MSACDNPTWWPAPARRNAISPISRSVVAKLLPKATTAEPRLENWVWSSWVIAPNRANRNAASSAVRFVATDKSAITLVNPRMFGTSTPSWPAASAIPASSSWVAGISRAISLSPFSNTASSAAVASTVLTTPANADSHDIAAFADATKPPATAAPIAAPAIPRVCISLRLFLIRPETERSNSRVFCSARDIPRSKSETTALTLTVIDRSATVTSHLHTALIQFRDEEHPPPRIRVLQLLLSLRLRTTRMADHAANRVVILVLRVERLRRRLVAARTLRFVVHLLPHPRVDAVRIRPRPITRLRPRTA